MIVELSRPQVSRARLALRFAARVLPETPDRMRAWHHRRLSTPPQRFGPVSVFLDGEVQTREGQMEVQPLSAMHRDVDGLHLGHPDEPTTASDVPLHHGLTEPPQVQYSSLIVK